MENDELLTIKGGTVLSASVVNALVRAVSLALELGRSLGSYIRRSKTKNYC